MMKTVNLHSSFHGMPPSRVCEYFSKDKDVFKTWTRLWHVHATTKKEYGPGIEPQICK